MSETLEQIRSFQNLRKKLTYNRWTPEANDELKTLWAMHQDDVLISKKIGRSESSIAQQRYKLGLVKFKKKPGKVLDIRRPQGGGQEPKEYGLEALIQTQAVLKILGYRLAITKLEQ